LVEPEHSHQRSAQLGRCWRSWLARPFSDEHGEGKALMYLLPAGSPTTRNKWGLGAFKLRPGLDGHRRRRARGLRGFGDDFTTSENVFLDTGVQIPEPGDIQPTVIPSDNSLTPPSSPALQNSLPVAVAYNNLVTQAQSSTSPLDYVSPQAAIAAGLNQQTVYNAWAGQMAKYPTMTAAIAAGIPAAIVTQLWSQSRQAAAAPPTATTTIFGMNSNTLLLAGAAIFGIALLSGRRR
jgi:hypothetical protein